jgi:hypothetical protein
MVSQEGAGMDKRHTEVGRNKVDHPGAVAAATKPEPEHHERPGRKPGVGYEFEHDPHRPDAPLVRMLMGDEVLRGHDLMDPRDIPNVMLHQLRPTLLEAPVVEPLAAPPMLGSAYTVTVPNPTPPTNISDVACGTPPHFTMVANPAGRGAPTYSDDLALMATAAATVPVPGSLTAIAAPIGGSSGPTSEATGTVVVVTAPGSTGAAPTQMISVQGNYTSTPNASHPSSVAGVTTLVPLTAVSTASGGTGTIPLTVYGKGFNSSSVVSVAAVAQTTVFVNPYTLTVAAAPRKATVGTSPVLVTTDSVASAPFNWTFT